MNLLNCHRIRIVFVIYVAVFAMAGLVQAATITVGPVRGGNYDYNRIQSGIDAAVNGDIVLVSPQEYEITEPITFRGKAITVQSEAGPEQTIIRMAPNHDFSLVVFDSGEDSNSLLEGFTITGSTDRGVSCVNSSPRIENCIFTENWESGIQCLSASPIINNCTITGSVGNSGINCRENSSATITNCLIWGNIADGSGGGGIYCNESSPTLINCEIVGNSANVGGGMHNTNGSSPTLSNCTFESNTSSSEGGGMDNRENCSPSLTNCTFCENYTVYNGGGMHNHNSNPTLTDCIFEFNTSFGTGGGMDNRVNSSPTLTDCIFSGNFADNIGGGMYNTNGSSPTLSNCTFESNTSSRKGGGMNNRENCSPSLTNCTFSGNSAQLNGGGIANIVNSNSTVINCILWDNTAPDGEQIYNDQDSSATVSYSDVQLTDSLCWPGEGNINIDPLFADPNNGDYHLKSSAGRWDPNSESWVVDDVNSPCIDAGDPNNPVAFEPYPNGIIINMGAYGGTAEASKSPSGLNAKYGGGTGEQNNPYLIYTAEQLNTLGKEPNDYDKQFKLMADVNMVGLSYDRAVIAPDTNDIEDGFQGTSFTGVFDGNDYRIFNLTIQGQSFLGLFGQLAYGARITNLSLELVDVNGTGDYIGGLVGLNNSYISESRCTGKVRGSSNIGGLVGENNGLIIACNGYGTVNGAGNNIGGLLGYSSQGTVLECHCKCNVSGWNYVGGLIGFNDVNGVISMNYCYGDLTGNDYVGGLVAGNYGSIEKSYSYSTVDANSYLGGLVGENHGSINNCYSRGLVIGNDNDGGLIGFNNGGSIAESFWDMETSGQSTSDGGTGKTTAEMQTQSTFTDVGWDFIGETENGIEDIWRIDDGDYPHLWWQ